MADKKLPIEAASVPQDFPDVVPRDLHATSDIRFVMRETATLTERIEGLSRAIEKLGPALEKSLDRHAADIKERLSEVKGDLKETSQKVDDFEKKVAFVLGATWVLGGLFAIAVVLLGVIAKEMFR